ncbi:hypothetical protein ElyMa_001643600 [Elysia marginata]|uniref:Uncharacterized protein n=1 Tax=Elysia marginata TaxID=1093978 RepID=A0AAV4JPG7_9GAST|nr:hypothetical protein ElyMa_001643600 [Elysia marginata]
MARNTSIHIHATLDPFVQALFRMRIVNTLKSKPANDFRGSPIISDQRHFRPAIESTKSQIARLQYSRPTESRLVQAVHVQLSNISSDSTSINVNV